MAFGRHTQNSSTHTQTEEQRQRHEHEALGNVIEGKSLIAVGFTHDAVVCKAGNGGRGDPHPHGGPLSIICIGCCDDSLEGDGEEEQPHDQGKAKPAGQPRCT